MSIHRIAIDAMVAIERIISPHIAHISIERIVSQIHITTLIVDFGYIVRNVGMHWAISIDIHVPHPRHIHTDVCIGVRPIVAPHVHIYALALVHHIWPPIHTVHIHVHVHILVWVAIHVGTFVHTETVLNIYVHWFRADSVTI